MRRFSRRDVLKTGVAVGATGALLATTDKVARSASGSSLNVTYDWTYNGPPGGVAEFWKTIQERLESEDRGVSIGELSESTFENLYSSVQAQIRAGTGSDVATWYSDYHTYRSAYQGSISAIDSLVSEETKSHWLINDSSVFNGQTWGHPIVMEIAVLAVNRRLLEQAGVEVGDRFQSYEAFIEACEQLKKAGIRPIQAGTSDGFNAEKWLYYLQFQVCDNITDLLGGVLGTLSLDAPFFEFPRTELPKLVDQYMNANPQNDTEEIATNAFLNGEAAMMLMYLSPITESDTPSEFDVVGFPDADVRFNRPAVGVADNMILLDYSEKEEAAGRLYDFLGEPEQVQLWWDLNRTLPANDQLDAASLPKPARRVWDMVMESRSQPFGLWWPGNLPPSSLFTFQYGVTQDLFAGATAEEARAKTEELFASWRQQNPQEREILGSYQKSLAKTAGVEPA